MRVAVMAYAIAAVSAIAALSPVRLTASFPRTITLEGELTGADYERLFEREFTVPAGTARIDVNYTFTGEDARTVVDIGLRSPSAPRGWSGGGRRDFFVSTTSATQGYTPGLIDAGRWAVLLGVPNIRRDRRDSYRITIRLSDSLAPPAPLVLRPVPGWYVGDLHTHSGHSDGRVADGTPAPAHRVFDAALAAGLDFVTLTDHNTHAHWLDVDRLQQAYPRLLLLHGREITTYRGHASTAGEFSPHDFRLGSAAASPVDVLQRVSIGGAFVSINHPTAPDDERCMGCGWNVIDEDVLAQVHGVEVVNGDSRGSPLNGWPFWSGLLNRGHRLTAVGGSDEHTPSEGRDRAMGTPSTVVWARELSEVAIVDGLKSGRVYLRTQGAGGPSLEFSAVAAGATYPMGAVIPASNSVDVVLQATLAHVEPEDMVSWIGNGDVMTEVPAGQGLVEHRVKAQPGQWFSLIVRRQGDPIVIANAIYVRQPTR